MQENNFEKHVQQKLEELKLDPSDSVWQNVYAKIKKEKRGRKGLIFFPVLFILILCGGIWLWFSGINSTKELQQLSKKSITNQNAAEKLQIDLNAIKTKKNAQENKTPKSITTNSDDGNNNIVKVNIKTRSKKIIPKNISGDVLFDFTNKSNIANLVDENKTVADAQTQYLKDENKIKDENEVRNKNKQITQHKIQSDSIANHRDSSVSPVLTGLKPIDQKVTEVMKKDIRAKEIVSKIKKDRPKWNWGIAFSAGVSDISQSFLGSDFLGYGSAEKSYFAVADNLSSSRPGTDTLSGSFKKPYLIKPSLALTIGFFAAKKISKNSSITLGINYKPYSTANNIGEKNESANNYQIQNPVNRYKNYYHFIEVPVAFSFQLAKPKKLPLILNAGISVSRLIASNALQFNNTSGIYYHDNSFFNKTQIGFNTGIYVSNKKNSMLIGPHIYYGTTKIANEGLYQNAHFTYLGLNAKFLFGKK